MHASRLFPVGAAAGLIGLVLVVLETTRALTDNVLGSLGEILLWVGVGLVVLGAVLLLLSVVRTDSARASDGGQPADG